MYPMTSSDNEQGDHNRLFSLCWKGELCIFLELNLIQPDFFFLFPAGYLITFCFCSFSSYAYLVLLHLLEAISPLSVI